MTNTPQDLFTDWQARIDLNQKAHWTCLERLDRLHFTLGLSAVILGTLAGATLLVGAVTPILRAVAGSIGLVAAVLAGIQTFANHSRRSGMHRAASTQLSHLRREIEGLERLPPRYLKTQDEVLLNIAERLARIEESAPQMQRAILRKLRSKSQNSEALLKMMKGRA